jgi:hypothetical protein
MTFVLYCRKHVVFRRREREISAGKECNFANEEELKGQCHEIFYYRFFHDSSSPKPLKITLGPFRIFLETCGDICKSRWNSGINDGKFAIYIVPLVYLIPVANNGNNI